MAKPTKIIHKSARGQVIDMAALQATNATKPALGNVRMNAQGDILDHTGNIVKRRSQIVQDYYKNNPNGVSKVSIKPLMGENEAFESPAEALARLSGKSQPSNNPNAIIPDQSATLVNGPKTRKYATPKKEEDN